MDFGEAGAGGFRRLDFLAFRPRCLFDFPIQMALLRAFVPDVKMPYIEFSSPVYIKMATITQDLILY